VFAESSALGRDLRIRSVATAGDDQNPATD
jgi:hypothetical protein